MRKIYFEDIEDFACAISDKFDELDQENFEDIAVIAKPDEVKEIFRELVCFGYDLCNIEFERIDWGGYDDEYILSLSSEGLWLEKLKKESGYIKNESTIVYILSNCSSMVVQYCKGKVVYEVTVGEDDCEYEGYTVNGKPVTKEEFDEYVSEHINTINTGDKDEKPATTSSTVTYKVNGKECDKDTYEKALNELDEKYLDNVQDMLLNYFDFVSEMNRWRRLLRW